MTQLRSGFRGQLSNLLAGFSHIGLLAEANLFVELADAALYEAKESGRDRVQMSKAISAERPADMG